MEKVSCEVFLYCFIRLDPLVDYIASKFWFYFKAYGCIFAPCINMYGKTFASLVCKYFN